MSKDKLLAVIAENLKELRRLRKLTQDALSERSGIAVPNISRIESQTTFPSLETVRRLAEAFGVTPDQLLKQN